MDSKFYAVHIGRSNRVSFRRRIERFMDLVAQTDGPAGPTVLNARRVTGAMEREKAEGILPE